MCPGGPESGDCTDSETVVAVWTGVTRNWKIWLPAGTLVSQLCTVKGRNCLATNVDSGV